MAAPILKFKRGALADLPSLAVGEPGFTTDRYQLYLGSDDGNKFIGASEFWTLNTTTAGSGVKFLEGSNNGTNYVQLQSPANVASNLTFELPGTDASTSGQVLQSNASGTLSFGDVNLSAIDIDGGTDIGAAIADADLFIVDDGASGTNRKTTASRLKTYVLGGSSGATFSAITVGSAVTINNSGIVAATGVITATTFDGNLTGNADTATSATAADTVKTVTDGTDASRFIVFVDDNNGSATAESLKTDAGVTYNPSSDTLAAGNVNVTTLLDVPTVETGAVKAKDGTAALTIADSTGKITSTADIEVQGTLTATTSCLFQGNTDIGNANTDTLTVAARIDSNLVPTPDATRNLGSASFAWHQGHIDHITGIQNSVTGVSTAGTFKGTTLEITGDGSFNGNVTVTGNLSVGGSVTNVDIEDLRVVSPVIELGLQRLSDGSLQPPASVTTKNSGITMYYNHVGVSSANAKVAAMFAKIGEGQDMRIGFATDVVITTVGAGDSVASVAAWADIEAKGLWINDCAGQSQVISCNGSTRNLENITVDGGLFT